jgi:hypothetical protein
MSVLRSRCAVCGSPVESHSARREGRLSFCSQSCFLEHESRGRRSTGRSRSRPARPLQLVRKTVKWALIAFGLIAVLAIVLAVVDTNETTTKPAGHRATRATIVRLRRAAAVGDGWRMRIVGIDWNATREVEAASREYQLQTPAHAQNVMLTVTATYAGGGSTLRHDLAGRISAIGKHRVPYPLASGLNNCGPGEAILPPPDIQPKLDTTLFSGTTLRGHICFEVATNDVRSLRLYVEPPLTVRGQRGKRVWFRLR